MARLKIKYNALPTIREYHRSTETVKAVMGPIGCYDKETEYLSPNGWRKISEYDGGLVAQYEVGNELPSFVEPSQYIELPCNQFVEIKTESSTQLLSQEHDCLCFFEEYGLIRKIKAGYIRYEMDRIDISLPIIDDIGTVRPRWEQVVSARLIDRIGEKKYCFTVPTGLLIMRRNGCIFISGNSGKSVGSIVEMWEVSRKQYPSPDGVRYTRWAVVRNSYPELKSTTIKTFQEWIPETICPIVYDSPIRGLINQKLPDGTRMHAEFLFLSLDKEKDISKLLSLELTGIFINEAREMPFNLVKSALSRTGRYPGKTKCPDGLRWTGMIMDTNPPDDDHWWYNLAENVKPDGWAFFKQPGALLPVYNSRGEITGYEANPAAENVENHQEGYRYWMKNVAASDEDWIKVYCCGEYGSIFDGKPVYKGFWSDQKHIASKPLGVFRGLPLTLMWDWGLTPAVAIGQVTPRGQFRILRELCCEDGGLKQFASNDVIPYLNQVFTGMKILSVGDPAGSQRSQGDDEITCFGILKSLGIPTEEAPTNKFEPRREAVINRLSRMTDGEPAFIVDPSCKMIIKGFRGGYKFEKVQVSGSDERFKEIACKNKFSHIHDALQYGCLFVDSVNTFQSAPPPPPIDASWDGMV